MKTRCSRTMRFGDLVLWGQQLRVERITSFVGFVLAREE